VNGTSGWAGPSCFCDTCPRCGKSVGRAPNPYTYHGHVPHGWPKQCYSFDALPDANTCLQGKVWKTVTGQNEASTLEAVCNLCDDDSPCEGFTVINTTMALVYSKIHANFTASGGTTCISGTWGNHWGGSVGVAVGGLWYSTTSSGLCRKGTTLGHEGCTWRYTAPARYYESGCVDSRVDSAVEAHGRVCFSGCPQPHNQTSLCYSECYASTLEGDPIHNITAMQSKQVTQPWADAFLPAAQGGCPELHMQLALTNASSQALHM